ncbi:3-carboxy-cis,cis-muconate cycloisomerase [Streptosporangium carneum]|uniref:3-carboxy-cis,cis-muconate cycloisomerase n=1 Tax=Streptosporangium carneum TaxID=47481 RepID=A0A9W6I530_9ACTN|nr:3-carboxy-cis,cis-muconate cycloisomerase [Streptosporangium carneum]GLK12242.1 3-carboxy-cis,cis-muconate cycloisomerase [Streptosporangium carneum]
MSSESSGAAATASGEGPASPDTGLLAPVRAGTAAEAATSDHAWLRAMLAAEAALARAQARAGAAPQDAARVIGRVTETITVDPADLARRARQAANPVVPLVAELRRAVAARDPEAAKHVHRGATSQDILDSAAMLVSREAVGITLSELERAMGTLAGLAETHRHTLMAARTLGQHAVPTTFGLRAADWLAGLLHARDRLRGLRLPAQLGGAAGTLAALGGDPELSHLFAEELGLQAPLVPWHAERSVVAELGAALAQTAGALGKVALDVIMLSQTEVGEVAESSAGQSSAMPHKRNPALSVLVRSAALQVPVYAQLLTSAQLAEHERAAGAWQAEWHPLRECLRLTAGAAETTAELVGGLRILPGRMRANVGLTGDRIVSERLAALLGRDRVDLASAQDGPLRQALAGEVPADVFDPADYLGAAQALIDRVLTAYREQP